MLVPAPEGMLEVSRRLHQEIPLARSGDRVAGIFLPPEKLPQVQQGDRVHDPYVMVAVPRGNRADDRWNTSQFALGQARWLSIGRRLNDPDARRAAAALGRWRSGERAEADTPLAVREGDRLVVAAESRGQQSIQLLTLGRDPAAEGGTYDIHAEARVLVDGRVLSLNWTRRGYSTVGVLAEASDDLQRWTAAVLRANP